MDSSSKTSRLPKPSGLKASQIKAKPLTELKLNRLQHNVLATSSKLALSRRSNSIADLRMLGDKQTISKTNNVQSNRQATMKTTQKRKIEKSSDEVKPKMIKQAKIPDWDYKSRFNQLRDKHAALNEDYKKQCAKLAEFADIDHRYLEIQKQHEVLEKNYLNVSSINQSLNKENIQFQTRISDLETNLDSLTKNHLELKQKYEALVAKDKLNTENFVKVAKENDVLKSNFQSVQDNYILLKDKHEKMITEYISLKNECSKIVVDNGSLQQNLDKEIQKCKDLTAAVNYLKKDVHNGEILRRKLHNTVQDLKGNIRVYCRVRPPINIEEEDRLQCAINFIDEKSMEIRKSRESVSAISGKPNDLKAEFTLDRVFEPKSTQVEIFEDLSQLVQSALDGYDICVFAYGQTGSGKTYTMQGGEAADKAGLIPRTIDLIFKSIKNLKRTGWNYDIKSCFLEIYNENVRDLLNQNSNNLEIRFNEGKGTTVTNLTIQPIKSACELKKWMAIAHRNRAVAATDFNEHSSRSHAVTKIYLQGINEDTNTMYTGSVNLVDLAGSESAKTSANERLVETKNINKSLSTLGSVMLALHNKEKHIPYRNSKLTYLLQSSLGGNSKTLMVVNIAPFEDCYGESINSLRFAAKVKDVKISAKRNKTNFVAPTVK